jgi:predicted DNA binding protein
MEYVLNYIEKGEKKVKKLVFDISPNRFLRDYRKVLEQKNIFVQLYVDFQTNINMRSEAISSGDFQKAKELQLKGNNLLEEIKVYSEDDILAERLRLIKYLYERNGIQYEGDDFWLDCVTPKDIKALLDAVYMKDVTAEDAVKKKALTDSTKID